MFRLVCYIILQPNSLQTTLIYRSVRSAEWVLLRLCRETLTVKIRVGGCCTRSRSQPRITSQVRPRTLCKRTLIKDTLCSQRDLEACARTHVKNANLVLWHAEKWFLWETRILHYFLYLPTAYLRQSLIGRKAVSLFSLMSTVVVVLHCTCA